VKKYCRPAKREEKIQNFRRKNACPAGIINKFFLPLKHVAFKMPCSA
jgi:hypothetical protein